MPYKKTIYTDWWSYRYLDPGLPLKQASAIPTSLSTTPFLCTAHNNVRKNKTLSTTEFTLLYCIFCYVKESSALVVAHVVYESWQ